MPLEVTVPVTVSLVRRARTGRDDDLTDWARDFCATAERFPGHLGSVVAPLGGNRSAGEVAISIRFASLQSLGVWERSPERLRMLAVGDAMTEGTPQPIPLTVVEDALRGMVPASWSRLHAVAVVWLALAPVALVFNLALDRGQDPGAVALRTLVSTMFLVPTVVLVTAPLVRRAFAAYDASWGAAIRSRRAPRTR